jgi:cytochrome c oxidase assembly protein Cox11
MIKKKTLTPVLLGGIFFLMLGLSFAAVPLYDMFCRITGIWWNYSGLQRSTKHSFR